MQNVRKSANAINKKIAIKRHPSKEEIKGLQESLKGFKVLKNLLKPSPPRESMTYQQYLEILRPQYIKDFRQIIQAVDLSQINTLKKTLNESDGDESVE